MRSAILIIFGFLFSLSASAQTCQELLSSEGPMTGGLKVITPNFGEQQTSGADDLLPLGSALITSSGVLSRHGIKHIIHAASGSMRYSGPGFDPTLKSVADSLESSLRLALANNITSVAIPFIGGGIFAQRIGTTNAEIASVLLQVANKYKDKIRVKFVLFGLSDYGLFLFITEKTKELSGIQILEGSITDFSRHGSDAIVNAANTEVTFGGGLSGAIGRATEQSIEIDREAQEIIRQLNGNRRKN